MNKNKILQAFTLLDNKMGESAKLLLGGGGALVFAYDFPLATLDLDAVFFQSRITEADVFHEIQKVASELDLPKDWLNPYFGTFLYTLPKDYDSRLKQVFHGKNLKVYALGLEDLLILKCFAGREKDIGHARALIKKGANTDFVISHLRTLVDAGLPKAQQACDFLDDLLDELGV